MMIKRFIREWEYLRIAKEIQATRNRSRARRPIGCLASPASHRTILGWAAKMQAAFSQTDEIDCGPDKLSG